MIPLCKKKQLEPSKSIDAYNLIQQSDILKLASSDEIEGWLNGLDGISYIIEHAGPTEYWFKHYWTPSAQDSLPEALVVLDFVEALSDTLRLQESNISFRNSLPHKGCYNYGGPFNICYLSNPFRLGYHGSTQLPFGLSLSLFQSWIGKSAIKFGIGLQYKENKGEDYDLSLGGTKRALFINRTGIEDFLGYSYRNRKLNFLETEKVFHNHNFMYGISIGNEVDLTSGFNYMVGGTEKVGGIISASRWYRSIGFGASFTSYIFKDDIDYLVEVSTMVR